MLVVGYGTDDGVDYWILKNRYSDSVLLLAITYNGYDFRTAGVKTGALEGT